MSRCRVCGVWLVPAVDELSGPVWVDQFGDVGGYSNDVYEIYHEHNVRVRDVLAGG